MESSFKADYTLYEIDKKYGDNGDPYTCEVSGYGSIEALKAESKEVLEHLIKSHKIPDGHASAELVISEIKGGVEQYVDNDACEFDIKKGKVVNIDA